MKPRTLLEAFENTDAAYLDGDARALHRLRKLLGMSDGSGGKQIVIHGDSPFAA